MLDRLVYILRTRKVRRMQLCPKCGDREYDSKWNSTCEPCWENSA